MKTSIVSSASRAAIAAILAADADVSAKHASRILSVVDAPDGLPARAGGWLPASLVAPQIGVHLTTLLRWIDGKRIHSRRGMGERAVLVNLDECRRYARTHPNARRGAPSPDDGPGPADDATLPGLE